MGAATRAPSDQLDGFYRAHASFVWRTVRYLGVAPADAEDVVHEVFVIVARRLDDYDPAYPERAWISGIARRVVMHHHRGAGRRSRKHAALEAPAPVEAGSLPDEVVSQKQAASFLEAFLDELDAERREVFVLAELQGLAAKSIADIVGCKVNTVYSRLRSARQAFQRKVERLETIRRRESG